ncbi:MAG: hypothetical protein PHX78_03870 [bacterium]|nr:hypothetical protein [bacterium]
MKRLKLIILLFLICFLQFNNVLFAAFADNAFAYCRLNLEKSGNQDILGLVNDILQKSPESSLKYDAILKAVSIVSIKDIKGYVFPENKNGQLDYLVIIDFSDKFSMEVGGRTIEFEIKDKDSLAAARMAAVEKLLKESLGGDAKLGSIEILQNKIFFNEEKENHGELSSFVTMPGKVILASSKILIRGFLKEGFISGEKIERFSEIVKKVPLQKGGVIFIDNKNGDITKFAIKIAAKKNVQVPDIWTQITMAGFSFEQVNPEKIKANLTVQAPKKLNETVEKQIQTLTAYEDLKIKKENDPQNNYLFIMADFICNKDVIDKLIGVDTGVVRGQK